MTRPDAGGGAAAVRSAAAARPGPPGWALPLLAASTLVHLVVLYAPTAPGGGGVPHLDKAVHLVVFAAVAFAARACARAWSAPLPVAAVLCGHAVVSELMQHLLLPGRSGDPWDVLANLSGVGVGLLVARRVLAPGTPSPG